jgi:hypothetical protein
MDAAPYPLSHDLKPSSPGGKERAQQKKGRILDEAQSNALWAFDSVDTTKTQRGRLTTQFTAPYQKQMSKAQQQFTLLHQCFYLTRDVIKWDGTWMGLVQEPLTRLPFEANSTCVELPYTTMWWTRLALEDSNLAGSLSLGEHVHTLYARPSVETIALSSDLGSVNLEP